MLCLLQVVLSCALLCLASPVPLPTRPPCPARPLFQETMKDLQRLSSKGSSATMPLNNVMEAGGNAATYLEGFIEALNKSTKSDEQTLLIQKLQNIQTYGESCTGWTQERVQHLAEVPWCRRALEFLAVPQPEAAPAEKQLHKAALKEHHWKAAEEYDFFENLEYLIRFLGHNARSEKTP